MTARGGLGSAFAAAVGDWPAASKQVVRVTAAPDGGWRVLAADPVPPAVTDVLDVPVPPAVAGVSAESVPLAAADVLDVRVPPAAAHVLGESAATDVPATLDLGPVAG